MGRACFFDFDGTLGMYKSNFSLSSLLTHEQRRALLVMGSLDELELEEYKKRILHDVLSSSELSLYEDSIRVIKGLKKEGFGIAIVSNAYPVIPDRIRGLFPDLLDYVDVAMFSSEAGVKKPDEAIFNLTLEKLNKLGRRDISPHEVLMVGNRAEEDIIPALNLGYQARLIDRSSQTLEEVI